MVGFDDALSKKSIPIGASANAIYLPNGTLIYHIKNTPLLHGGANSLISTVQAREFGIVVHDVDKSCTGKVYIYTDNRSILTNFDKALCICLFSNPPSGRFTTLTVLYLPQNNRGIYPPSSMH